MVDNNRGRGLRVPGLDSLPTFAGGGPSQYRGSHGHFRAWGAEITQGRDFEPSEFGDGAEPVMMVSEIFAREIWPNDDPLTKCVTVLGGASPEPCRRVVGVFEEMVQYSLEEAGPGYAYPIPADIDDIRRSLIVRTDDEPTNHIASIREAIIGVSGEVRFVQIRPVEGFFEDLLGPWTLGATMFTAFGLLALVLAAVGLYSVLAFGVAQRQRELGIRSALGASGRDLIRMVMSQAGRYVGGGLVLGTLISLGLGRFVEDLLFNVRSVDPFVYGTVILTLAITGAAAAFLPAWRATAVSPTTAIQVE